MKEKENQREAIDQEVDDTFLCIYIPLHGIYLMSTWNVAGLSKSEGKFLSMASHGTAMPESCVGGK